MQLTKHSGAALVERVRALEAALHSADAWDARYEAFETACRFGMYGEPPPPAPPPSRDSFVTSRFWPKLRPLRDAMRAFESKMALSEPGWTIWGSLVPAVLRAALEPDDHDVPPLAEPGRLALSRRRVLTMISNAFLLNVQRGSSLDFLGGGPDPLYVTGASLGEPKLLCILAYLAHASGSAATGTREHGGAVEFVRARLDAHTDTADEGAALTACEVELRSGLEIFEAGAVGSPEDGANGEAAGGATGGAVTAGSSGAGRAVAGAAIVSSIRGQPFGGGPLQGGSATEQECVLLGYPEALLGLWVFAGAAGDEEVFLVRGARHLAHCNGPPHELRFQRVASLNAPPITLLWLDASRKPGSAQFAPEHAGPELKRARRGLLALRAEVDANGCSAATDVTDVPSCSVGLWGCGGFAGAQPIFRTVLLLLAASAARVRLVVCLPRAEAAAAHKWYAGVLSEIRSRGPTPKAL